MTKHMPRSWILLVLFLTLSIVARDTAFQQPATNATCPALVQEALRELETNCGTLGRNVACYGYNRIGATFTQPVAEDYFSRPADRADLITLQSIATSPMDLANNQWGVALLSVQANLPGTLPGQSVTFILLGDAMVVNAVPEDDAQLPVEPIMITTAVDTVLRSFGTANSNVLNTVPAGSALAADALSEDGSWVRVVYGEVGGWVRVDALASPSLSGLPVVTTNTRTPMQAFLFRTGVQEPACTEAPSSVVVQGPTNTQVNLNVNGADIIVGSTVQLTSVIGAPLDIVSDLDLPPDIQNQIADESQSNDQQECALMQLSVVSGEALLNEGQYVVPEGNAAWSLYCAQPGEDLSAPFETPETGDGTQPAFNNMSFSSDWGAFRTLTEEELAEMEVLENLPPDILNYEIDVPEEDEIVPVYTTTPTPTDTTTFGGAVATDPATETVEPTLTPTNEPPPAPTNLPPSPAIISATAGTPQSTMVGTTFTVGLQAQVMDGSGNGVAGVNVTFTAPASGASGTFSGAATVTTNALGYANAPAFTANGIAGSYAVTASTGTLTTSFNLTNLPGGAAAITAVGGTPQSTQVTTTFPTTMQAQVTDGSGNGVPGVNVTFSAPASGASGTFGGGTTVVTDTSGVATAPSFTANTLTGSYTVTASAGALTANFSLTNAPSAPTSVVPISGGGQNTTVNTVFAVPLQAFVEDAFGNLVPGVSVTFSAPASGASVTFASTGTNSEIVVTDSGGIVTTSAMTANAASGTYDVSVMAGAVGPGLFSLTNDPALNPVPSTSGLTPNLATAGDPGFILTLDGANFVSGAVVTWQGQADLIPVTNTGTQITVNVPASYVSVSGTFNVGVTNPAPGGGASNPQTFTVNPSTVVTSLNDSGAGTLRDVVAAAPPGSTVTFAVTGTISLSTPIIIDKNLTVDGPGANALTISGGGATRIFALTGGAGVNVTLLDIRLDAGSDNSLGGGGTIQSDVTLTLDRVWVSGSTGSGIYTIEGGGTVAILNSTFSANNATTDVGGAFHANVNFTVVNSTFQGNGGTWGAFSARAGSVNVINSTFADNTGSGIENQPVFGTTVTLTNVILYNTGCGGTISDGGSNLVFPAGCSGMIAGGDPLLAGLTINAPGTTPTMALNAGSTALDTGNGIVCTTAPVNSADQRGATRTATCDIGAYEG